ncbi:MAG: phage tail protein [Pseudomonas mandelii]
MPWYKTGTVSVVLNSNAVIGTGTAFIANSRVGDGFRGPDGGWYEVTNIASDTAMSISPNYQGATNGAGGYALAPLQGYVKDSADALRSLVNQYGAKLGALGTTGNYDILPVSKGGTGGTDQAGARSGLGLGAAATENTVPVAKGGTGGTDQAGARSGLGLGAVATENTVPVAKGGTGGNTQAAARTGLGLGAAAVAAILGTVSQTGGVPTGAIIEKVVNANGEATKFADGRLICTGPIPDFTVGAGAIATVSPLAQFPVFFIDTAYSFQAFGSPQASLDVYGYVSINAKLTWNATAVYRNGPTAQTIGSGRYLAIGRWF